MTGRIRSLKPEWLDDEPLQECGTLARLLSVALILMADDHGRGRANAVVIAAKVFTYEPDPVGCVREALARLSRIHFVDLYTVRGQHYYAIHNWAKHQRVDKKGRPRFPGPEEADQDPPTTPPPAATDPPESGDSGEPRETLAEPSGLIYGSTDQRINGSTDTRAPARGLEPAPENVVPLRPSDPHEQARRLLTAGYQRRYEAIAGDAWMGASRAYSDIGTCAAYCAAKPDQLEQRVEALLEGVFSDPWLGGVDEHGRPRCWPWGAIASNPARYCKPKRSRTPEEHELDKLDRAMERAVLRGDYDEQARIRERISALGGDR